MKKRKIGDIILWSIVVLFLVNTVVAYISYKQVSDNKKPSILINKKVVDNKTIYNEGIYNIIVMENEEIREVSLKLFFLK